MSRKYRRIKDEVRKNLFFVHKAQNPNDTHHTVRVLLINLCNIVRSSLINKVVEPVGVKEICVASPSNQR